MIRLSIILLLSLQFTLPAEAISRIGKSSIGDQEEGFKSYVSEDFVFYKQLTKGGLVITTPPTISSTNSQLTPSSLKLTRFSIEFPELKELSRADLRRHMADNRPSWAAWDIGQPCIETFTYRSQQFTTVFATWGNGRGLVVFTGASLHERRSLRELLISLELNEGACSWP